MSPFPLVMMSLSTASTGWPWGWIVGVACGIALMIAFDLDWRRIPERAHAVVMATRRKAGWAVLAVGSIGVLVFY